jgi:probable F420-dependent oxidoreductase
VQPFRFAVYTNDGTFADDWTAFARRVEEHGYAALYVTDHLNRQLAPTAALAAAAAVTRTLRIGPYVFANDFRHPLLVAREAATLDRLSGGRLDLGLGAGWRVSDYRQLGIPYDRPGVRIDRLAESLGLIKRLLAGEEVTHQGRFYRLEGARVEPAPVQRPHPRIMLGGGGPRMLRLAAAEAAIVGFLPQFSPDGRPMIGAVGESGLAERVEIVRRAAGPRFEDLELNVFVADAGVVGGSQSLLPSLSALAKSAGPALLGGSAYLLYGTIDQLRESMLRRREELGISSYGIPARALEAFSPLVASLAGS